MSEKKMIDTGFQRKLTRGQKSGEEPLSSPFDVNDRQNNNTGIVQQPHDDDEFYDNQNYDSSARKSSVALANSNRLINNDCQLESLANIEDPRPDLNDM